MTHPRDAPRDAARPRRWEGEVATVHAHHTTWQMKAALEAGWAPALRRHWQGTGLEQHANDGGGIEVVLYITLQYKYSTLHYSTLK